MSKARNKTDNGTRAEYDFARGVRGKHATRYARGTNVVVLAPDVARVFRTERSVNKALRGLAGIISARTRSA
jgi:hypothetical protein